MERPLYPRKVMAGLRIEESDRGDLKQREFEPFPGAGTAKERDLGPEGTPGHRRTKRSASESPPAREEAA